MFFLFLGVEDNKHFVLCQGNCITDTSSTFYNHSQSNWNLTIKQTKALFSLPNKFLSHIVKKKNVTEERSPKPGSDLGFKVPPQMLSK